MAQAHPTIFPPTVVGDTSPYPTVVMVISDHQKEAGMFSKPSVFALCSA
jgi:hypothetical protein